MLTIAEQSVKVPTEPSVVFIDSSNKICNDFIHNFSSKLNGAAVTLKNSFKLEQSSSYDYVLFFVESFNSHTTEQLTNLCKNIYQMNSILLLVYEKGKEKELLPYLTFPLNGIVSLSYLQEHPNIIYQQIEDKGVFLEPQLHRDLIFEIERKKLKDTPIEKLVLNREKVKAILTENEQDVLQLILEGYNNQKIAKTLYLAPSTISTIISHLLRKLQANDRTDAMVKAIRNGWVDACR